MSKDHDPADLSPQLQNALIKIKNVMECLNKEDAKVTRPLEHLAGLFDSHVDITTLERLFERCDQEGYSFPDVSVCSRAYLNGARSGYVLASNTICIAQDFATISSESQMVAVLLQEILNAVEIRAQHRANKRIDE